MPSYTAIDLFSGAGGLSLGLKMAGFNVKAALENNPFAAKTYEKNLGAHMLQRDIHDISGEEILNYAGIQSGQCDLLAGGPPCQGFSIQRRGSDKDSRNELVLEFMRIVEEIRPKFFVMENVSGLMSKRGRPFLDSVIEKAKVLGYLTHLSKLEAADFGVPQMRKRVILVGGLAPFSSGFEFPKPTHSPDQYRTVHDAIADLPSPPVDGSLHINIANHAREAKLSATNRERLKHIPPGGGRLDLPEHLQLPCHKNNPSHRHIDVYGRLEWNKPSGTITARFDSFTRGRFAHPVEHRSLTLREGARLQTFPDDFVFEGNREEAAKQIGNAVPPLLAQALGKAVINALQQPARVFIRPSIKTESSSLLDFTL